MFILWRQDGDYEYDYEADYKEITTDMEGTEAFNS
jgi:hypothetical protein